MVQALAMKKWPQSISSTRCSRNILSSYVTIESNPPELSKSLLHNWTSATRIAFWRTATSTAKGQDGGASAEATIGVDNLMGTEMLWSSEHLFTSFPEKRNSWWRKTYFGWLTANPPLVIFLIGVAKTGQTATWRRFLLDQWSQTW